MRPALALAALALLLAAALLLGCPTAASAGVAAGRARWSA